MATMNNTVQTGFSFPSDVDGWLDEEEGTALNRLAKDRRVLEIGSYCGRSTICMAQSAAHVVCVDPFDGRATPNRRDTLDEFSRNLDRYGVSDKVFPFRMTTEEASLGGLEWGTPFDMAFIDGDHNYQNVIKDFVFAASRLVPGGIVAFHDYDMDANPQVVFAVQQLLGSGLLVLERAGRSLLATRLPMGRRWFVPYIATPTRGMIDHRTHTAIVDAMTRFQFAHHETYHSSVLTQSFNATYADCLNARGKYGITHFVMLHDDVFPYYPPLGMWLDVLVECMERHKLGVVSAVIPIKSDDVNGETSTAIDGNPIRRLTVKDCDEYGPVLTSDAVAGLLINTGCMVIDVRQRWADEVVFEIRNSIVSKDNGVRYATFDPEDWRFSRWMSERRIRYGATTAVRVKHVGVKAYDSHPEKGGSNGK